MSDDHDQAFVRTFLAVLGVLAVFTIVIVIISRAIMSAAQPEEMLPAERARIERRAAPAFDVVTDAAQAQQAAGAETGGEPAQAATGGEQVAQATGGGEQVAQASGGGEQAAQPAGGEQAAGKSGEEVYNAACSACHQAGVAGAPKLSETDAWKQRLSDGGKQSLYDSAINGLNAMPAKGGNPGLSDAEVEKAVDYMLEQAGA